MLYNDADNGYYIKIGVMKIKRLLSGVMVLVFFLNLICINVNAKVDSEESKNQNEKVIVVLKDKNKEDFGVVKRILFLPVDVVKSLWNLLIHGFEHIVAGCLFSLGSIMMSKFMGKENELGKATKAMVDLTNIMTEEKQVKIVAVNG